MRKALISAAAAFMALNASTINGASIQDRIAGIEPLAKVRTTAPLRAARMAYGNPDLDLTAVNAEFWYYGDVYGNGTGVYYLIMSNTEHVKGVPVAEGQMARIYLVADAAADKNNPTLPTGTFTYTEAASPAAGEFVGAESDYLDVFSDPDGSAYLYSYEYKLGPGSIEIDEADGGYSVSGATEARMYDDDGTLLRTDSVTMNYYGVCDFTDPDNLRRLDHDVDMGRLTTLSGNYRDGGGWSLAFFDLQLDHEGFIASGGQYFNLELDTADHSPMNPENLIGSYSPCDLMATGGIAGCFGQGFIYELYGTKVAMGTYLQIYNDQVVEDGLGLAESGTVTITKTDEEGNYRFDFDVTTFEGKHVTGYYEGNVADCVVDYSKNAAVEGLPSDSSILIKGGKGEIVAPAEAKVFTLHGVQTGRENLPAGIYIVRCGAESVKVIVK